MEFAIILFCAFYEERIFCASKKTFRGLNLPFWNPLDPFVSLGFQPASGRRPREGFTCPGAKLKPCSLWDLFTLFNQQKVHCDPFESHEYCHVGTWGREREHASEEAFFIQWLSSAASRRNIRSLKSIWRKLRDGNGSINQGSHKKSRLGLATPVFFSSKAEKLRRRIFFWIFMDHFKRDTKSFNR